jgi:hypothetical protein
VALWGLLVLFAGGDVVAHFTKYKYGETVSASLWWLEKVFPVSRVLIGLVLAVLFTHLEFHLP